MGVDVTEEEKDGKPVMVVLGCSGAEPTRVPGRLRVFSAGQRALRAAGWLGLGLVAAAVMLPIPIIHLLGIPLVLLVGIGAAIRQTRSVARLAPMKVTCPKCGEPNSIGGGIGFRTETGPIERRCEACRRGQTLSFEPRG